MRSSPGRPEHVQGAVGGDGVEPRAEGRSLLEARQTSPRREQRFLHRVLGVLDGAEDPVAMSVELLSVRLHELAECGLVAGLSELDQVGAHAPSSHHAQLPRFAERVDTRAVRNVARDRPVAVPTDVERDRSGNP